VQIFWLFIHYIEKRGEIIFLFGNDNLRNHITLDSELYSISRSYDKTIGNSIRWYIFLNSNSNRTSILDGLVLSRAVNDY